MIKQGPCRDCSENIEVAPDKIEEMLQYLVKTRNMELVDDETSNKRLSLCMGCTAYAHGGTCKYCGCLVQIRTKIQGERCPYPLNPKW
jgi:hypothetical protein